MPQISSNQYTSLTQETALSIEKHHKEKTSIFKNNINHINNPDLPASNINQAYLNITGRNKPDDLINRLENYSTFMDKFDDINFKEGTEGGFESIILEDDYDTFADERKDVIPAMMATIALKKPELKLKYFDSQSEFADFLLKNEDHKIQSIVKLNGHFIFIDSMKKDNNISLICIESSKHSHYLGSAINNITYYLQRNSNYDNNNTLRVKKCTLGIQQDRYNCPHYALSIASKSSSNRPFFDKYHNENFNIKDTSLITVSDIAIDQVPATFLKHAQTRKILQRLTDKTIDSPVNKKGDTLQARIEQGIKDSREGLTSISHSRNRWINQLKELLNEN